jgi:hypothetical protein
LREEEQEEDEGRVVVVVVVLAFRIEGRRWSKRETRDGRRQDA